MSIGFQPATECPLPCEDQAYWHQILFAGDTGTPSSLKQTRGDCFCTTSADYDVTPRVRFSSCYPDGAPQSSNTAAARLPRTLSVGSGSSWESEKLSCLQTSIDTKVLPIRSSTCLARAFLAQSHCREET